MKKVVRRLTEEEKRFRKIQLYPAILFGKTVYFSDERVKGLPENCGIYKYEIRHDDGYYGDPCEISTNILVNFYGTVLSTETILLPEQSLIPSLKYADIDIEKNDFYIDHNNIRMKTNVLDLINRQKEKKCM